VESLCALHEVVVLLRKVLLMHIQMMGAGNYRDFPEIQTLFRLYDIIHLGICSETSVRLDTNIPGLRALLLSLPVAYRLQLMRAIIGEQTGYAFHVDAFEDDAILQELAWETPVWEDSPSGEWPVVH
jgi:hypothetical protein